MGKGMTVAEIQELVPTLAVTVEPVGRLQEYAGNAKEHTAEQVEQIKASMRQVGFCDPIGVWTNAEGKSEVVEGHGRLMAALELGLESVPVIHLDGLSDEQRRFYALVHNKLTMNTGWDFDKLDAELDGLSLDFDMASIGFDMGDDGWDGTALSTEGRETNAEYDEFTAKFEPKLTTDDCYTPDEVYQAVKDWACNEYGIDPDSCVRPFYPGGDYERFDYPDGCTVLDNPPFSIMSKIIDFYEERGIRYFLFGPGLSLFSGNRPCNYLVPGVIVTYENGAKVNTGFVTSYGEWKIDTAPDLAQAVADACKQELSTQNTYEYPSEVVTSALIMKIARRGVRFRVKEAECAFVRKLDGQTETGQGLFGGGFLISSEAAAEREAAEREAAEKAKKAAERKEHGGMYVIELSERERAVVASISRKN